VNRARPGRFWFVTVMAIVAIVVTASLGQWQLSRAAQKEALQAMIDARGREPALDQPAFVGAANATDTLHRTVHLRGLWLGAQTLYLDNRQMHGVPGFYVLTPFALEGSDQTVLVQRGWIQRNFESRMKLQPVQTPAGLVEVDARIAPPPSHLLELGKPKAPAESVGGGEGKTPTEGSSPIRQNLDLEAFRAETDLPLRTDVTLQQTGGPSEGLQRDWPAPTLGVERHYGYAFQWFGLSALVAFLYVWFQFIAPRRKTRHAAGAGHV
jgi:cytochrome oxidase assembly protein ShyY1